MSKDLEELIGKELRDRGWRLAVAESCTGGLIGHRITNISGSSTYYLGSITAYAYRAKVRLLGVSWDTLEEFGAVSEQTIKEMSLGVRRALAADIGLAVSGIAGPTGGTPDKPVGYTWIGLSTPEGFWTLQHTASGNRIENKQEIAQKALEFIHEYLVNNGKD
jgi:PncC family amidohydrolase